MIFSCNAKSIHVSLLPKGCSTVAPRSNQCKFEYQAVTMLKNDSTVDMNW